MMVTKRAGGHTLPPNLSQPAAPDTGWAHESPPCGWAVRLPGPQEQRSEGLSARCARVLSPRPAGEQRVRRR